MSWTDPCRKCGEHRADCECENKKQQIIDIMKADEELGLYEEPKTNLERLEFPKLVEELFKYYRDAPLVEKEIKIYSEEEVIQLLIKFNQEIQEVEDVRNWFKQFKNK